MLSVVSWAQNTWFVTFSLLFNILSLSSQHVDLSSIRKLLFIWKSFPLLTTRYRVGPICRQCRMVQLYMTVYTYLVSKYDVFVCMR